MRSIFSILLVLSLLITSFFLGTTVIKAQGKPAFGISIEPPVLYVSVKPGESYTHSILLENQGQQQLTITPTLVDFAPTEAGQGINLENVHTFPYLDPSQTNPFQQPLIIEPGGKTTFHMPIRIPASAPTKEYHLTVLFSSSPHQTTEIGGAQTTVAGSIGSNIVLLVSQDDRDLSQLSIKSVQGAKVVDSFGQINLKVIAQNSGPTATVASGSAVLKDWRGKSVQTYEIFPDVILANSNRQLRVVDPAAGGETPVPLDTFSYDSPFLLGPYTFEIELVDTNQANRASSTTQIWALPFSVLVVIILGLALVLGYLFSVKKLPIGKQMKTY